MTDAILAAAFLVGAALLAAGAWMIEPAAGLIVAGVTLIVVPLLYVRGRASLG